VRLASYDDAKTPEVILAVFGTLTRGGKTRRPDHAGLARAVYGKALMEAVATKKIAANDVPAEIVRQLRTPERHKPSTSALADVVGHRSARRRPTGRSSSPTGRRN